MSLQFEGMEMNYDDFLTKLFEIGLMDIVGKIDDHRLVELFNTSSTATMTCVFSEMSKLINENGYFIGGQINISGTPLQDILGCELRSAEGFGYLLIGRMHHPTPQQWKNGMQEMLAIDLKYNPTLPHFVFVMWHSK